MSSSYAVSPSVIAGITTGIFSVFVIVIVIALVCWKLPFCRTRHFWDQNVKKIIRTMYGKCRKSKEEEKLCLINGAAMPSVRREETPFVVPQILVQYGSRRGSEISDFDRRESGSSFGSRRTSLASDSDRRGSGSSFGSRRTSCASDTDRRGSGSSFYSRRTSLASDTSRRNSDTSRRNSNCSSRSSRKGSDEVRLYDVDLAEFSEPDGHDLDELVPQKLEFRRASAEAHPRHRPVASHPHKEGMQKRSHSAAEIQAPGKSSQQSSPERGARLRNRRETLSSLVMSSMNALDSTVNPVNPSYYKKKAKLARRGSVGLPFDTPLLMHDLNLEEMMVPRFTPPIKPTGILSLQLYFNSNKTELNILIIEAQELVIPGAAGDAVISPFVKGFLVPGRTAKFRTKTLHRTKNPVFLEKFTIKELSPSEITEDAAIEFQVYTFENVTKRHLVGVCTLKLNGVDSLPDGKAKLTMMPQTFQRHHHGDLRISGCYQPVAGKMVFNILEARHLPKVSLVGTINPYIKAELFVNNIREGKHKTKPRQNTQDPLWHHQCVFEINRENPKLLGHVFTFTLIHKDMMTGIHRIGQVDLGWYSHGEQLDHWYEIMEHPHRPTDYWHPIIKTTKSATS